MRDFKLLFLLIANYSFKYDILLYYGKVFTMVFELKFRIL